MAMPLASASLPSAWMPLTSEAWVELSLQSIHPVQHHGVGGIAFGHIQRQRRRVMVAPAGIWPAPLPMIWSKRISAVWRGEPSSARTVVEVPKALPECAVVDVGVLRAGIAGAAVTEAQRADLHDDAAGIRQRAAGAAATEIADREADRRAALIGRRRHEAQPSGAALIAAALPLKVIAVSALPSPAESSGRWCPDSVNRPAAIARQRDLQQRRIGIGHLRRPARAESSTSRVSTGSTAGPTGPASARR